jgi:putative ABC transport system permease protein
MSPLRLAWLGLAHQRLRSFISLVGVGFAVVLIFMQLGFLGAVERTATQLYDRLDFDLLLLSSEYLDLNRAGDFSREHLAAARALPEVESVVPLCVGFGTWRPPRESARPRRRWTILVLGVEPARAAATFLPSAQVYGPPSEERQALAALGRIDTVLLDVGSRPEYGEGRERAPGAHAELNDLRVEIGGACRIGTGFGYNGLLITNEDTFAVISGRPREHVTFGLVRLRPGTSLDDARANLRAALPSGVVVTTRQEISERERRYWVEATAVGRFFSLAVVVALVVGVAFVYNIMAGDIRNHLPEYATLKAMGYRNRYLSGVVLAQAVLLALASYLPGLGISLALYALAREVAGLPVGMTVPRALLVLALAVAMCLCSGLFALRKLRSADPADLF